MRVFKNVYTDGISRVDYNAIYEQDDLPKFIINHSDDFEEVWCSVRKRLQVEGSSVYAKKILEKLLRRKLPICYLQFLYSRGNQNCHILCTELCEDDGGRITVDAETSMLLIQVASLLGIETYQFRSNQTNRVSLENMPKCIVSEGLVRKYLHLDLSKPKHLFKEVHPLTQYIVLDFQRLPNSYNYDLETVATGAICIKVTPDIDDERLYS